MKSSAQPANIHETWDDHLPCVKRSAEDWTLFLYGKRPGPHDAKPESVQQTFVDFAAGLTATALNALERLGHSFCMEDAWFVTSEHYSRRFEKLLAARKPEFTCRSFVSFYKKDLRRFARALGHREIARRGKFLSVSPLSQIPGDTHPTLDALAAPVPPPLCEMEKVEVRSLYDRVQADLPKQDRKICTMFSPADSAPRRARAMSVAQRQADSRAVKRFQALCQVHRQTENAAGRCRIERAVFVCLDAAADSALAEAHLLAGKSLDELKCAGESRDTVRFRFLRGVMLILPVIDPERVRALDLLPARHRAPLAAFFFHLRPLAEVARTMGSQYPEARADLRLALADLRVLHAACVSARSPRGVAELAKLADSLVRPGSILIRRILLGNEVPDVVGPPFGLTAEQAREELLKSLKLEKAKP